MRYVHHISVFGGILVRMTETSHSSDDRSLLPWSHRRSYVVRVLITILAGVASGVVGTMAHRMGAAQNIPYGLLLAFVILGLSTWCARARCGVIGIGFHLIASSAAVWYMAAYGPGGDVLVPVGFSVDMPFFVENAGTIWMWSVILIQVAMLVLPRKWFTVPPRLESIDWGDETSENDPAIEHDNNIDTAADHTNNADDGATNTVTSDSTDVNDSEDSTVTNNTSVANNSNTDNIGKIEGSAADNSMDISISDDQPINS